jgi:formamidopyrimidine-DNA glycosylase
VPELPEVETVRARLEPAVVGRRFERVDIYDPRLTRPEDPLVVAAELVGERVAALERRGKYLVFRFESGRGLLVHLRMTGGFRHAAGGGLPDDPYRRAVVSLDDGSDIGYRDVRRFGTWTLLEPHELEPFLAARLGEEPLAPGFTARSLATRLANRRAPVKAALLDQRTLAGMGNIYADEALWRARIHPLRPARELGEDDIRRLHRGVRRALEAGLARQGATIRDYATPDGAAGTMQHEFKVYGREGEPCPRCRTPIEKIRAGGRGTWYCPHCQPLLAPAATNQPPAARAQAASSSSRAPVRSRRQSSV